MLKYTIVDPDTCPVDILKKTVDMVLKPMDKQEVEDMGQTPREALGHGISNSSYARILLDASGEPKCAFGVVDTSVGYSIPWMLTTADHKITKEWLKHCKDTIFPEMCEGRTMFTNVCHKDNKESIKWLKWLGFSFQRFNDNYMRFMMDVEEIEPVCVVMQ
jgi:hypothetical protein